MEQEYFENVQDLPMDDLGSIRGIEYCSDIQCTIHYIVHKDDLKSQTGVEHLIYHSSDLSLELSKSEMISEIGDGGIEYTHIAYVEALSTPGKIYCLPYGYRGVLAYKPLIKVE